MFDRYSDIEILKSNSGVRYYTNNYYPDIELSDDDIYVQTVAGDRAELLASEFFGDQTLYWIIMCANPDVDQSTICFDPGTELRIPANYQQAIEDYKRLNNL